MNKSTTKVVADKKSTKPDFYFIAIDGTIFSSSQKDDGAYENETEVAERVRNYNEGLR